MLSTIKLIKEKVMSIQITDSEMMEEVEWGSDTWEVVEEGVWTQDYKYQHKESVVKHIPTGKFYQYEVSRSGSPLLIGVILMNMVIILSCVR